MLWLVAHYLWLSNLHHGSCSLNYYSGANCLGRNSPDKIFLYAPTLPSAELCYTVFSIMLWLNPLATWEYTGKLLMSPNSSVTHCANPAHSDNSVCIGRRAPVWATITLPCFSSHRSCQLPQFAWAEVPELHFLLFWPASSLHTALKRPACLSEFIL